MEAEVRSILREHLCAPAAEGGGLASDIRALVAEIGGADDLELPERRELPRAADLES
jgi:hypothetical protein